MCHGNRQAETPWSGRAGVKKKHASVFFDTRLVRVSADHDADTRRCQCELKIVDVVDHVQPNPVNGERCGWWQYLSPPATVHVAAYGHRWRDLAQFGEYLHLPNVTGMDDLRATAQGLHGFGPEQSVGVGNHPDQSPLH